VPQVSPCSQSALVLRLVLHSPLVFPRQVKPEVPTELLPAGHGQHVRVVEGCGRNGLIRRFMAILGMGAGVLFNSSQVPPLLRRIPALSGLRPQAVALVEVQHGKTACALLRTKVEPEENQVAVRGRCSRRQAARCAPRMVGRRAGMSFHDVHGAPLRN
jgi:hypothetical protein